MFTVDFLLENYRTYSELVPAAGALDLCYIISFCFTIHFGNILFNILTLWYWVKINKMDIRLDT